MNTSTFRHQTSVALVFIAAIVGLMPCLAQPFTYENLIDDFPDLTVGAASFVDIDADGDYDLLLNGRPGQFARTKETFSYLGTHVDPNNETRFLAYEYTLMQGPGWSTGQAWGDYNNDGWMDVVITGITSRTPPYVTETVIYNGGNGGLERVDADSLPGLHSGTAAWADYNNDGDQDLLLTGVDENEQYRSLLYRNNDGHLSLTSINLPGVAYGDAEWGDYDLDGDLDLVLVGSLTDGAYFAGLFRNDDGRFQDVQQNLQRLHFANVAWGDYDADGDLDLALNGGRLGLYFYEGATFLYENREGTLHPVSEAMRNTLRGDVGWGDYDVDGDLDLLLSGAQEYGKRSITEIYRNDGGAFRLEVNLPGVSGSSAAWGDSDADGDLDLLLMGTGMDGRSATIYYRNTNEIVNSPPAPPTGLDAVVSDGAATLSWEPSRDVHTAEEGLSYAVRVGTAEGGVDVVSPMAHPATGRRYLPERGNAGLGTTFLLKNLSPGTYYWSVQAIDASYSGSGFADESTFTINQAGKGTSTEEPRAPLQFRLENPQPNPTIGPVTIAYTLPRPVHVQLAIYNVLGRRIAVLKDGYQRAGEHHIQWDGRTAVGGNVGAGVYFCRLSTEDGRRQTRSLTIIR